MDRLSLKLEMFDFCQEISDEELGSLFREMINYSKTGQRSNLALINKYSEIFNSILISRTRSKVSSVKGKNLCNQNAKKKIPESSPEKSPVEPEQRPKEEVAPTPEQPIIKEVTEESEELILTTPEIEGNTRQVETIDYKQLAIFWNQTVDKYRSNLPHIKGITDNRKTHVDARLKMHSRKDIAKVIENAAKSEFFNNQSFANFDWIFMSEDNFRKTLEGNYNRKKITTNAPQKMSAMGQIIQNIENSNANYFNSDTMRTNESTSSISYASGSMFVN